MLNRPYGEPYGLRTWGFGKDFASIYFSLLIYSNFALRSIVITRSFSQQVDRHSIFFSSYSNPLCNSIWDLASWGKLKKKKVNIFKVNPYTNLVASGDGSARLRKKGLVAVSRDPHRCVAFFLAFDPLSSIVSVTFTLCDLYVPRSIVRWSHPARVATRSHDHRAVRRVVRHTAGTSCDSSMIGKFRIRFVLVNNFSPIPRTDFEFSFSNTYTDTTSDPAGATYTFLLGARVHDEPRFGPNLFSLCADITATDGACNAGDLGRTMIY